MVKLNVDATILSHKCWLAVVARDDMGNIVKYWSKAISPNAPVVAEANAILWTVQIAKAEEFRAIIVEGDAKICFDVLNGNAMESLWSISSFCSDIKFLSLFFFLLFACLVGVFRESNLVAHTLAKFAA